MARDDMREVSFVEVDEEDGDAPRPPPARRRRPHADAQERPALEHTRPPRKTRRTSRDVGPTLRRLGPVGLVLTVAAVTVAAVAGWQQGRERDARIQAVPGVLAPVGGALEEVWRRPAAWEPLAAVDDDLLVTTPPGTAEPEVLLVDGATGAELWTAPVPELEPTGQVHCIELGTAEERTSGGHLACRLATATAPLSPLQPRLDPPARSLLVVLDRRSGERVAVQDLGERWTTLAPVGSDVVVVHLMPDHRAHVVRMDPVDGETRWTFRTRRPLQEATFGSDPMTPVPRTERGVLVTDGPVGLAMRPDGTLLGEWHPHTSHEPFAQRVVETTVLADGRYVLSEPFASYVTGWVVAPGGQPGSPFAGAVVRPVVDDDSAPHVLLARPEALVGIDTGSVRTLWQTYSHSGGDVIRLEGRVVSRGTGGVAALDAATGRDLWTVPTSPAGSDLGLFTDGRVVLVPTQDRERGPLVVAVGIDDGRERWAAAVPRDVRFREVGGHLVGFGDREVVAYG